MSKLKPLQQVSAPVEGPVKDLALGPPEPQDAPPPCSWRLGCPRSTAFSRRHCSLGAGWGSLLSLHFPGEGLLWCLGAPPGSLSSSGSPGAGRLFQLVLRLHIPHPLTWSEVSHTPSPASYRGDRASALSPHLASLLTKVPRGPRLRPRQDLLPTSAAVPVRSSLPLSPGKPSSQSPHACSLPPRSRTPGSGASHTKVCCSVRPAQCSVVHTHPTTALPQPQGLLLK